MPSVAVRLFAIALAAAMLPPALPRSSNAQPTPRRIADINTVLKSAGTGSDPTGFVVAGGLAYFLATDSAHGTELWVTNGTPAGTRLLKDISPGPDSTTFVMFAEVGGGTTGAPVRLLFGAGESPGFDTDLWLSDGTEEGTQPMAGLLPGAGDAAPRLLGTIGGVAVFGANSSLGVGRELFRSDGTEAGTFLLADLSSGPTSSNPAFGAKIPGWVYFVGPAAGGLGGKGIYRTNGTLGGTSLFAGTFPNSANWFDPHTLTPSADGSLVYFSARYGAIDAREVWRTDGTGPGSFLLKDIRPGDLGSNPRFMVTLGSRLIFQASASSSAGVRLWTSDGTTAGTVEVQSAGQFVRAENMFVFNDRVLFDGSFSSTTTADGWELWSTDGTSANTSMIANLSPGSRSGHPADFVRVGDLVYFHALTYGTYDGRELFVTDGTEAGTSLVADINPGGGSDPSSLAALGAGVVFAGFSPVSGREPMFSDGTPAGTTVLADINPLIFTESSNPVDFKAATGRVFFGADDGTTGGGGSVNGYYTTRGPGTEAERILDAEQYGESEFEIPIVPLGAAAVLWAYNDADGGEIYASDGTAAGTAPITEFCPGPCGEVTGAFTLFNGQAYFYGPGASSIELWRSDGTGPGTVSTGAATSGGSMLALAPNLLIYSGFDASIDYELWSFDGTTAALVADLEPGGSSYPSELTSLGDGRALFSAYSVVTGVELGVTDGTAPGTALLDLVPGADASFPDRLTPMGTSGRAIFAGSNSEAGSEPWITDGTLPGTLPLADIVPGAASSYPDYIAADDTRGFFICYDPEWTLHVTDGTPAGTSLVRTLDFTAPTPYISLAVHRGIAYFPAGSAEHGDELWQSDGTHAGTVRLTDINPGEASSSPERITRIGSRLYFSAIDPTHGREPWVIDLCPADFNNDGVASVQDVYDYLTAWSALDPAADLNGTSGVSVQDIYDFLTAWSGGCGP